MQLASSIESAESLMKRLDGGPTVAGIVPKGFKRYLRVFSPASASSSFEPNSLQLLLPWSLICEQLGVELKPNTLWQRDIVSADPRISGFHEPGFGSPDTNADLPMRLGAILQQHEAEDRTWYFASWVGYGVEMGNHSVLFISHHHDSLEMSVFERWNEANAAFTSPLVPSEMGSSTPLSVFGYDPPTEYLPPGQLPMYWWPEGQDWVIGQALYGRTIYLACNDAIADEVLAAKGIEAIEVSLSDEAECEE